MYDTHCTNSRLARVVELVIEASIDIWQAIDAENDRQHAVEADFTKKLVAKLRSEYPKWNCIVWHGKAQNPH